MNEDIEHAICQGILAIESMLSKEAIAFIEKTSMQLAMCFRKGGKVLVAGNGGSLCDAMHFAEELTGQFRHPRKALPAIALSDPGHLTCTANDMGYEHVFARAIEALGKPEDIFIALSTSGNSPNLLAACKAAHAQGLSTISFLGKKGGKLKGRCHLEWIVDDFPFSDRIQEAHMTAMHIIVQMVEKELFGI